MTKDFKVGDTVYFIDIDCEIETGVVVRVSDGCYDVLIDSDRVESQGKTSVFDTPQALTESLLSNYLQGEGK